MTRGKLYSTIRCASLAKISSPRTKTCQSLTQTRRAKEARSKTITARVTHLRRNKRKSRLIDCLFISLTLTQTPIPTWKTRIATRHCLVSYESGCLRNIHKTRLIVRVSSIERRSKELVSFSDANSSLTLGQKSCNFSGLNLIKISLL